MLNVSETTAAGSAIFSACTLFLHLWGSKQVRINGELTAQNLSIEAANTVRKDMEAALKSHTARLDKEIAELKVERKEWEAERRQLVAALHESEKSRIVAEGQRDRADDRVAAMELRQAELHRLSAIEARLAELLKPAA